MKLVKRLIAKIRRTLSVAYLDWALYMMTPEERGAFYEKVVEAYIRHKTNEERVQ